MASIVSNAADAVITVKASRYLTHVKRLKDPQPSVDMLMERVRPLREKLGPVLIQLPPDLRADVGNLKANVHQPKKLRFLCAWVQLDELVIIDLDELLGDLAGIVKLKGFFET